MWKGGNRVDAGGAWPSLGQALGSADRQRVVIYELGIATLKRSALMDIFLITFQT